MVTSTQLNIQGDYWGNALDYILGWSVQYDEYYPAETYYALGVEGVARPLIDAMGGELVGADIQITSSTSYSPAYAVALQLNVSPIPRFNVSTGFAEFGGGETEKGASARMVVAYDDSAAVYFGLGDVTVDGTPVKFQRMTDSVGIRRLEDAQPFLISEAFNVQGSAPIAFKARFGTSDSARIQGLLSTGRRLSFTPQLVDAQTGEVLEIRGKMLFDRNFHPRRGNIEHDFVLRRMQNLQVRMRWIVEANFGPKFAILDFFGSDSSSTRLGKNVTPSLAANPIPDKFMLNANFPNPFNPSTQIRFDLPEASNVRFSSMIFSAGKWWSLRAESTKLVTTRLHGMPHRLQAVCILRDS